MRHFFVFCIFSFVFFIFSPVRGQQPGVWESHGPYTHAQTTAFYVDSTTLHLYVATANQGVYVSDTGGSSWESLSAPLDTARITSFIKIDETLFAAKQGNCYSSANGYSWTRSTAPSEQSSSPYNTNLCKNFIVSFNETLFAGALWGYGLFRSSDNGANWESVSTSLNEYTISTFLQVGDTLFAATLENGIYYSSDGSNWTHCGSVLENQSITHLLLSENIILAAGAEGLYLSIDGTTWNSAPVPLDTLPISLLCSDQGILYAAAGSDHHGLYFSDDSAVSWNLTLPDEYVHCLQFTGEQVYAGTESGLYSCPAGTHNWRHVQLQPDPGEIVDLAMSKSHIYTLSAYGIFHSAIGQQLWFPTKQIKGTEILHGLIVDESFILTYGSRVYRSIDDGLNWETAYPPVDWGQEKIVKILETNNGFIAAANGIFHSQDGIDWQHTTSALDNTSITTLVSADYILLTGTETNGIYISSDQGNNWIQANPPMHDKYVHFIYPKQNRVYAGTDNGLYFSDNSGLDWTVIAGIPDTISVLSFNAYADTLLAGTAGQGIYYSTDNSVNWIHSAPPVDEGNIEKIYVHPSVSIAGTDKEEIFLSHDDGMTWNPAEPPIDDSQLTDFSSFNDILFISGWDIQTGAAGIFRSIDTSKTWTPFNKNLSRTTPILAPFYLPSINRLFTCGDGVAYQEFDLDGPVIKSISPDDTLNILSSLNIEFRLDVDGADSMRISEDPTFADVKWRPYFPLADFLLSIAQGVKNIYFQFKDFSYNETITDVQIKLDTCPPWGLSPKWTFEPLMAGQNWVQPEKTDRLIGDHNGVSIVLEFRHAGEMFSDNNFFRVQHRIGRWSFSFPGEEITNRGFDFRFMVSDSVGNRDTLRIHPPLSYVSREVQLSWQHLGESDILTGGTDTRAFHIVSVPFKVPQSPPYFLSKHMSTNFIEYGPKGDWIFWSYEGDSLWIDGNNIEIHNGTAYFVVRRENNVLRPRFPSENFSITTMRTLDGVRGDIPGWQLRANDWTLIGNPYRARIELGQLKLKNRNVRLDQAGTALGIYAYTSAGWTQDAITLEPWSGLAVFLADTSAASDTIVFADAEEPFARPPLGKTKHNYARNLTDLDKNDWLVQILAESHGSIDKENYFGVRSDALTLHDIYDLYEPTRLPGGISVSFPHTDWSVPTSYASDIRAVTDNGYTWLLQVNAEGGTAVSLNFETLGDLPDHFQLWLIDETTHIARNLRTQPHIQARVPEQSTNKKYKIIVGTDSFVKQKSDGINTVPSEFVLYQNYPNPFNPVTVIRYALPVEGEVTLQIFDVLGRVVNMPEKNIYREPGYYEVLIDLTNYSSGLYFYSIHVDGERTFNKTRKMLFIK